MNDVRTWIEIDKSALRHNTGEILKLVSPRTRLMAVVKSNAYGHGLTLIAKLLASYKPPATSYQAIWFGVDSITEGLRLRREGIKNPILVLGGTLPSRMVEAAENGITVTVSNFEALAEIAGVKNRPDFHLKIDTGMHRQGFLPPETFKLIKLLKRLKLAPRGVYTHFASAKDVNYPTYTLEQLRKFNSTVADLKSAGFKNLIRHAAASGGVLLFPESRLDMVRVGMSLYGYWPSPESKTRLSIPESPKSILLKAGQNPKLWLKPTLTWKTLVGEVKEIPAGSFVGYDLTERVNRKAKIAVLPVGYWHGFDRGLSSAGEVLIRGRRARVLGRVSMDMVVVDVTDIVNKVKSRPASSGTKVKIGDEVVLIGKQGKEAIWADEMALKLGTTPYEVLTRINPLIRRV